MKRHTIYLTFLFFIFCFTASSQQMYSGQIFSKPLFMNAAYSGSDMAPRLVSGYLHRTIVEDLTIQQSYASFDIGIKSSGIGAEYILYKVPFNNTHKIKLSYAHEFEAGNFKLRPAVSAGIVASAFDLSDFPPFQVDPVTNDTFFFEELHPDAVFSAGAGIIAQYKDLTIGFYADQINKPVLQYAEFTDQKLYPQIFLHADYKLKIGKSINIIPGLVYFYNNPNGNNKGSSYYDPSLRVRLGVIELGYSKVFGTNYYDATSLSGGMVWKYFRLKYSYTRETGVRYWTGRVHEITFSAGLKKE